MDVLLLKEMVGEAQFGTRPKRMVGDALYIDGSYFDPFYIARALHWWSDLVPAAFFGRLIWKEEDNGTTRVDTTCRALVLASEYMRVAISPIEGYGDSSVTYPASATIYQL